MIDATNGDDIANLAQRIRALPDTARLPLIAIVYERGLMHVPLTHHWMFKIASKATGLDYVNVMTLMFDRIKPLGMLYQAELLRILTSSRSGSQHDAYGGFNQRQLERIDGYTRQAAASNKALDANDKNTVTGETMANDQIAT